MNKYWSYKCLFSSLLLLTGCSDIENPEKLETEVYIAHWAEGEWILQNDKGEKVIVTVYPDGSVLGNNDSIGSWFFVERDLYITWMSGWIDLIEHKDGHFEKYGFAPGVPTSATPTNHSEAIKVKDKDAIGTNNSIGT